MKNILNIILLSLLLYIPDQINGQNQVRVLWEENINLAWSDFLDTISDPGRHDAKIYTSMEYSYSEVDDFVQINLFAFFDKDKSIKRINGKHSAELLTHELFHFHITEFVVRKFRKNIMDLKNISINNIETQIKLLFDDYWNYHDYMQDLYDKETDHSLNKCVQEKWQHNILDSLKIYDNYQKPQIRLLISK